MLASADQVRRLRKRSEFLRVGRGLRANRVAFQLQAVGRDEAEPGIGFTVTRRVGNAPERNRIKRRLRAAARACEARFRPQHDYVLVGRRAALTLPFGNLVGDLVAAIAKIHSSKADGRRDDR